MLGRCFATHFLPAARCAPGTSPNRGVLSLLSAALALVPAVVAAQTVTLVLEREVVYGDDEVTLFVKIEGRVDGLGEPRLEAVDGLSIRGPSMPSRRTQIINGVVSNSLVYHYLLKPLSAERRSYTIGPVTVPRRGQPPLTSSPATLKVLKRPPRSVKLRRQLSPTAGPVLSPFRVTYTIYYSGERADEALERDQIDSFFSVGNRTSPFGLAGLELPLLERREVKLFPVKVLADRSGTPVRLQGDHQIYIQEGSAELDGLGYRTLVFGWDVVPLRAGPLEIAPAEVKMQLLTDWRERVVRDLFRRRRVREPVFETHAGTSEPTVYDVEDPPAKGRPATYNGAVGRYSIDVSAAPTEVDAFTPIKLEVRVRCENPWPDELRAAILENLSAPRWSRDASLTRDFGVSTDVHAGVVEGDTKVFTQTIRPLGDHVKEVPPIPFPYFDPDTKQYAVAHSRPIPLKVSAVETVDAGDAIRGTGTTAATAVPAPGAAPAVSIVAESGIAANFQTIGEARASLDPRAEILAVEFVAVVVAPPAALLVALLLRRRRRDPIRAIREKALGRALQRLASGAADPVAAFQDYFRDRLQLAQGELTPADLNSALSARGVPEELRKDVTRLLERFLSARFGGGASEDLPSEARRVLKDLEPCLR